MMPLVPSNLDWQECIDRYDRPGIVMYIDPPYIHTYIHTLLVLSTFHGSRVSSRAQVAHSAKNSLPHSH